MAKRSPVGVVVPIKLTGGRGAYQGMNQSAGSGKAGKANNSGPANKGINLEGPGSAPDHKGAPGGAHGLSGGEQG